ncbi:MAG TPA: phytoene desaturase family protein [Lentimicrobium sp.]|nr:phytoene desaturase family protein [Lentimicrobium sp.]
MSRAQKVLVIGAGFSGLSSATYLAREGYDVTVIEKNSSPGGRARQFTAEGFTFDMGPSWYWMPDIFESYFSDFGKKVSDFYNLVRLDPSYQIWFGNNKKVSLPASIHEIYDLYESLEPGSTENLRKFLEESKIKYDIGIGEFVQKPSNSFIEFLKPGLLKSALKLNLLSSFASYTRRYFKNPSIRRMLEFPILFLGGTAENTPALYSLMNYSDMVQGTWYPEGGMFRIVEAMVKLAEEHNVKIEYNNEVTNIVISGDKAISVTVNNEVWDTDFIIASGDYHHIEQKLLPKEYRKYSNKYWDKRILSPSSLIFFLGVNARIPELDHHTLLFDQEFKPHADSIYSNPSWPENPSIYISCTSKTDSFVAPEGHENLMVLIPVAPGLEDSDEIREHYFDIVIRRLESFTGQKLSHKIVFKKSYAHNDFIKDYNAYKGNAYGLANTLMQTAFLKPSIRSKKVKNLFFAGQLTVPGPGVPPAIISGKLAARELINKDKKNQR